MEDLKRKIQSQEGIPVDPQIISFGNSKNRKTLSLTCPQCKTADNRSLGEIEEFKTAFGHSGDENKDEFKVSASWPQIYVQSKGAKLSHVTIKDLVGKTYKISIKVNQTTNLIRIYF